MSEVYIETQCVYSCKQTHGIHTHTHNSNTADLKHTLA